MRLLDIDHGIENAFRFKAELKGIINNLVFVMVVEVKAVYVVMI